MEVFNVILGLVIVYSIIHLFLLQKKGYEHRTKYEKVITWVGMIGISLVFLGIMFGN